MRNQRPLVLLIGLVAVLVLIAAAFSSQSRSGDRADRLASPPDHLIVVIEENHSFEQIIGSPAAPFLNRLAAHGTLLTHY